MSLSHHLAAVWFADVVGYTRLSEENEGEAVRLVDGFQRVAREVVARHGGRIVKFLGDGALAEFSSTDMAVRSAEALIRAFAALSEAEGLASDELRVGVHVGDVVATEDGDLYGDGVNVASRIQAAGDPGEVWVSEDVRRQLRQRPEFRFESRGERELKGLSRPLAMHAVEVMDAATWAPPPTGAPTVAGKRNGAPSGGPAAAARAWTRRRAVALLAAGILIAIVAIGASTWFLGGGPDAGESAVLAVLPFENLSGDEETEPFVLGVHDDLLTHLSRLGTFKVISRTTMMGYEGSTKSVPEIAKELGATTVLEGGIQRSGDRIRMNVQLIDAHTDEHLWGEQYDRTLTAGDVFTIQAKIAEEIAEALVTALTPEQKADIARAPTDDLEALDLYYQGLAYYRARGRYSFESARRAESLLAAAVEADPEFAAAWAALAQARAWQLRTGVSTDRTGAHEALDRAVALAPEARETTVAEGVYLYYARADFAAADDRFQVALARWPDDADLLGWRSLVLRRLGRWEESLELWERAREIDPQNPEILSNLGETYDVLRRWDEADRTWDQVLALNPRDEDARDAKLAVLWRGLGDMARARRFLETSADVMTPAGRARSAALISLYERDYEAGIAALEGSPVEPDLLDTPFMLAILSHLAGLESESRAWADSLRVAADRKITDLESGSLDPFANRAGYIALRGIAHALSARPSEALRDGRRALELLPLSRDAVDAPQVHRLVAIAFLLAGDRDGAFRVLNRLATVPAPLSSASLQLDPIFDSIRGDPRYAPLLRSLQEAERSGTGTR